MPGQQVRPQRPARPVRQGPDGPPGPARRTPVAGSPHSFFAAAPGASTLPETSPQASGWSPESSSLFASTPPLRPYFSFLRLIADERGRGSLRVDRGQAARGGQAVGVFSLMYVCFAPASMEGSHPRSCPTRFSSSIGTLAITVLWLARAVLYDAGVPGDHFQRDDWRGGSTHGERIHRSARRSQG